LLPFFDVHLARLTLLMNWQQQATKSGAMAGGVIGGVVVLVAVILFLLLLSAEKEKCYESQPGKIFDLGAQQPYMRIRLIPR